MYRKHIGRALVSTASLRILHGLGCSKVRHDACEGKLTYACSTWHFGLIGKAHD